MLITRVPDGLNPIWGSPLLLRRAYQMLELSWLLYMFLWWSCYVRRRQDGFQYSSTRYQVRVGAYGHVLSCQALNVIASRGASSDGAYPVLKTPGHSYQEHGCILCWG
jgi:hypothetical protein